MKTSLFLLTAASVLLPAVAMAAKGGKVRKNQPPGSPSQAIAPLKAFDKNANNLIDADELPAMQEAFAALRGLDKDGNGTIGQAEADSVKPNAARDRTSRRGGQLKAADKNGNRKIDPEEVEGLKKAITGTRMMKTIDSNKNGKLDEGELTNLNKRLQHADRRKGSPPTPTPKSEKAPVPPASPPTDTPKTENLKAHSDPFLPKP